MTKLRLGRPTSMRVAITMVSLVVAGILGGVFVAVEDATRYRRDMATMEVLYPALWPQYQPADYSAASAEFGVGLLAVAAVIAIFGELAWRGYRLGRLVTTIVLGVLAITVMPFGGIAAVFALVKPTTPVADLSTYDTALVYVHELSQPVWSVWVAGLASLVVVVAGIAAIALLGVRTSRRFYRYANDARYGHRAARKAAKEAQEDEEIVASWFF